MITLDNLLKHMIKKGYLREKKRALSKGLLKENPEYDLSNFWIMPEGNLVKISAKKLPSLFEVMVYFNYLGNNHDSVMGDMSAHERSVSAFFSFYPIIVTYKNTVRKLDTVSGLEKDLLLYDPSINILREIANMYRLRIGENHGFLDDENMQKPGFRDMFVSFYLMNEVKSEKDAVRLFDGARAYTAIVRSEQFKELTKGAELKLRFDIYDFLEKHTKKVTKTK